MKTDPWFAKDRDGVTVIKGRRKGRGELGEKELYLLRGGGLGVFRTREKERQKEAKSHNRKRLINTDVVEA